jgi:hypothetical protein
VGVQSVLVGLLAEVMVRTYYESQNKRPYIIGEVIGRRRLSGRPHVASVMDLTSVPTLETKR